MIVCFSWHETLFHKIMREAEQMFCYIKVGTGTYSFVYFQLFVCLYGFGIIN